MDNDSKDKMLFQEFIPPTKQEWIDKANVDLKGADFDKRLVWKNLNGINIQPLYNLDDQKVLLNNTGVKSEEVVNFRRIDAKDEKIANIMKWSLMEHLIPIVINVIPITYYNMINYHVCLPKIFTIADTIHNYNVQNVKKVSYSIEIIIHNIYLKINHIVLMMIQFNQ